MRSGASPVAGSRRRVRSPHCISTTRDTLDAVPGKRDVARVEALESLTRSRELIDNTRRGRCRSRPAVGRPRADRDRRASTDQRALIRTTGYGDSAVGYPTRRAIDRRSAATDVCIAAG